MEQSAPAESIEAHISSTRRHGILWPHLISLVLILLAPLLVTKTLRRFLSGIREAGSRGPLVEEKQVVEVWEGW